MSRVWSSAFGRPRRLLGSTWMSRRPRSLGCWDRTARGRRRSSGCWPRCSLRTPDGPRCLAATSSTTPRGVRELLGLTGQFAAVDEKLTGRENLQMFGRLFDLSAADARRRASELLERFDLADAADRPARTYSGGMRRRLDLASSLRPARACCSWTS